MVSVDLAAAGRRRSRTGKNVSSRLSVVGKMHAMDSPNATLPTQSAASPHENSINTEDASAPTMDAFKKVAGGTRVATQMAATRPAVMAAQYAPASSCPVASLLPRAITAYDVTKFPKPASAPTYTPRLFG